MKKVIIPILLTMFLSSCATTSTYQEPTPSEVKTAATIQGFEHSKGFANWHAGRVTAIDNKSISYSMADFLGTATENTQIPVLPGTHTFVVHSKFVTHFSFFPGEDDGPFETITEIQATLLPQQHYHLNGQVDNSHILLWIEDANNKRISNVVSASYHQVPRDNYVYMPTVVKK